MGYDELFSKLIGKVLIISLFSYAIWRFQISEEFLREKNNDAKCHSMAIVVSISS